MAITASAPVLEMRGVTQWFGGFRALDNVDFHVEPGEIVALCGENGSGKSTLIKILAGINAPDPASRLFVGGREVPLPLAPGQFRDLGLAFVHQDLGLARSLTVAENLVQGELGSARARSAISWRREHRRVRELLESYDVHIDPQVPVNLLPPVGQALVAIVRAAEELKRYRDRADVAQSILVLDEPTVFLPESGVDFLFDLVRTVVAGGTSTIFISHDLAAVRALCHRVVVLRDGRLAGQAPISEIDDRTLIDMIVGQESGGLVGHTHRRSGTADIGSAPVVASVRGLRGGQVRDTSFDVRSTEIVGLAGLLGSGAEEVPYLCFGAQRSEAGTMVLDGRSIALPAFKPWNALAAGVALVPADRRRDGIAPMLTVSENATILVNDRYTRFGAIQGRRLAARVDTLVEKFDVRPRRPAALIGRLSGGNQQKVVLAKWLETGPRLLLLHEPTQGVDVAARAEIYRLVREATEAGMATVWVSSDFEELVAVCDRVLIMADGVVRAELTGDEITEERISAAVYEFSAQVADALAEAAGIVAEAAASLGEPATATNTATELTKGPASDVDN
ncbi:MAG: sugar ABC transporter ATP-binding protein [Frankia sp.]|nr:sugar ABC transporter ATP-binding protein [Frankia sp.]